MQTPRPPRHRRLRRVADRHRPRPGARHLVERRRGSTLVVVISLLALLSILGITINLYTQQSATSAKYASEGAKNFDDPNLDPNVLFDFGLEQLIIGANDNYRQSALYGGRHSLLPTMFGRDLHPYSGAAINLVDLDNDGAADLDQDFDGVDDAGPGWLFALNNSAAAHGGNPDTNLKNFPDPDPDYTRPDVNSSWLAFDGYAIDATGRPVRVVIPSFLRPQLLRQSSASGRVPLRNWDSSGDPDPAIDPGGGPDTSKRSLRPHTLHEAAGGSGVKRFVRTAGEASALGLLSPFPFGTTSGGVWNMESTWQQNTPYDAGDWMFPQMGNANGYFYQAVQSGTGTSTTTVPTWPQTPGNTVVDGGVTWQCYKYPEYAFDADPDNDGVKDGIWLDLGFPVQERGDKKLYIPLFSFRVLDADQLANLNAHGNDTGIVNVDGTGGAFGGAPLMLSQSNHGLTPYEVNLGQILNADPSTASTGTEFDRLNTVFSQTFNTGSDWREVANAELFTLMKGLPHADTNGNLTKPNIGRYGSDGNRAVDGFLPGNQLRTDFAMPGRANVDDEGNLDFGEFIPPNRVGGQAYQVNDWVRATLSGGSGNVDAFLLCTATTSSSTTDPAATLSVTNFNPGAPIFDNDVTWMIFSYPWGRHDQREFGHPYDIRGGGYVHTSPTAYQTASFGPNRWLQYGNTATRDSATAQGFNKWALGGVELAEFHRGSALTMLGWQSWVPNELRFEAYKDDPMEMFTQNANLYAGVGNDAPFSPSDAAYLHFSPSDLSTTGKSSRLAALASWNLANNARADEIRKRLTPISWDLRTFGITPGSLRSWETTAGVFPPDFPNAGGSDPIRQAVRDALYFEAGLRPNGKTPYDLFAQRMLSANHIIDTVGPGSDEIWGVGPDDSSSVPFFRRLTQHPPRPSRNAIGTMAIGSMSTVDRQEYEARRDRQKMARDIYVLLYLLGGGDDGPDYTNTNNNEVDPMGSPGVRPLYDDAQLNAMAQFAVNLVDAMDPDDVITKFEFDRNLYDGWDVDDNPYGDSFGDTIPVEDLGIVWGVEEQTLTLSEALVVQTLEPTDATAQENPRTEHSELSGGVYVRRDFTFVELRNAAPHPIGFDNEAWKIVVQPFDATAPQLEARHLIPMQGAVGGGGLFEIGTAGDVHLGNTAPSRIAVDLDATEDGTFETIIAGGDLDLDLVITNDEGRFRIHRPDTSVIKVATADPAFVGANPGEEGTQFDNSMNKGDLLHLTPANAAGPYPDVEFVLMRRAHPYREPPEVPTDTNAATYSPQTSDNPWIEVDRMRTKLKILDPGESAPMTNPQQTRLDNLRRDQALYGIDSSDRDQPLVRTEIPGQNGANSATADKQNTFRDLVNNGNNIGTTTFNVLQVHFDRDFTSPIDLFTVPLYGPADLVDANKGITRTGYPVGAFPNSAGAARFLKPVDSAAFGIDGEPGVALMDDDGVNGTDDIGEVGNGDDEPKYTNKWYRLLGLLGTPSPMIGVETTGSDQTGYRLPGKINWNTLSYPEVLAALIDDDAAFEPFSTAYNPGDSYPLKPKDATRQRGYLADAAGEPDPLGGTRDWWKLFLEARDGKDPVTNLLVPGTSYGRPFRSTSYLSGKSSDPFAIEQTMLRGLPIDNGAITSDEFLGRRLFEIGTAGQRFGTSPAPSNYDGTGGHVVDLYTRHRLLSRMWGNSTNRSNVLYVHVQVDFFEVGIDNSTGTPVERIGGKLPGMPTHRGFFVVDRSLAYKLLKGDQLRANTAAGAETNPNGEASQFSIKGLSDPFLGGKQGFNFRNVIVHREVIQ